MTRTLLLLLALVGLLVAPAWAQQQQAAGDLPLSLAESSPAELAFSMGPCPLHKSPHVQRTSMQMAERA